MKEAGPSCEENSGSGRSILGFSLLRKTPRTCYIFIPNHVYTLAP